MQGLQEVCIMCVTSGEAHCAAIARDGEVYMWGRCGSLPHNLSILSLLAALLHACLHAPSAAGTPT